MRTENDSFSKGFFNDEILLVLNYSFVIGFEPDSQVYTDFCIIVCYETNLGGMIPEFV